MLNNVMESNVVNKLYNDIDWAFTEFYSTKNNIDEFIEISREIEKILSVHDLRYRYFSILGSSAQHAVNVAVLNGKLACLFNLDNKFELILGGLLHDVGKFYISRDIRNKPGRLTEEERKEMSKHTEIGYELLRERVDNENVLNIVRNHHLNINSLSYPTSIDEVKGDVAVVLPLICGISDIIDAMLSYRAYKKPLTIKETKEELIKKGIKNVEKILSQTL
ncbi:HD domain-containing protein [Tissierella carlieri]|uniref:HD domain-containing protein n=1 Tax=Tissierella carlieri TaxID=689904 RepID=A0ABT1SEH1_9FIRM|nr:HD domain-containing protein [Tissierella carlieri]MCQ4924874.1 HD domain-containing protein [Tissierella carlieri]